MSIAERRIKEQEELRSLIIDAAQKLFLEKGIGKTTIRNIAESIDYSVGTIYVYFKDKNAILFEIIRLGFSTLKRYMADGIADIDDPYEQLRGIGYGYMKFATEHGELYDLMFSLNVSAKNADDWDEEHAAFRYLQTIVAKCIDAGYFTNQSVGTLSLSMWSIVHGLSSLYIHRQFKIDELAGRTVSVNEVLDAFMDSVNK